MRVQMVNVKYSVIEKHASSYAVTDQKVFIYLFVLGVTHLGMIG